MKLDIELEVPEGYECVRAVLDSGERIDPDEHLLITRRIIVIGKKPWQWPEWLLAEWIAMDRGGEWVAYMGEPKQGNTVWLGENPRQLSSGHYDFTPPPCTDWKQSKRRNPNK